MREPSLHALGETLKQHGLDGAAFDVAAITDELAGWLRADADLDRLLEDHPVGDPTAFEPEWR